MLVALSITKASAQYIDGKIAFSNAGDIWMMNGDGSNPVRVIDAGTNDVQPAWSPDGRKIAFKSDRDVPPGRGLYVVNADGTGLTLLTGAGINNSDADPTWSPDGTKIAFGSNRDAQIGSIYVMNADGSNVTRLTNQFPISDGAPAWSPDGSRIAFETNQAGSGIAVININGTGRTFLGPGRFPAWSPDSTRIIFADSSPNGSQLFVMNASGTGRVQLTNGTFNDSYPAWKSDGQKIAFIRNTSGQVKLWTMNSDGSNQVNITAGILNAGQGYPDWQHDYLAFPARVCGRALTANGAGLYGASVSLSNETGLIGMARSSSFGYFCFEAVEVQRTYTATISSKRYQFSNPSQSVVVNFDIENLVFNALP